MDEYESTNGYTITEQVWTGEIKMMKIFFKQQIEFFFKR